VKSKDKEPGGIGSISEHSVRIVYKKLSVRSLISEYAL
jgi:hypothetical protein